jgi:nucleotidyltransferase substrate binding protein (TIGR01987 family)
MEKLDLTSFKKILDNLNSILVRYNKEHDPDIRDAVIQRFEYTYSMSLKMLVRFLKQGLLPVSEVNEMTFSQLIRRANTLGLLRSNLEVWDVFRQKRNMTFHAYDEEAALEVLSIVPDFKDEVMFLYNKLKDKLSGS